jgi:hypothetical protein
MEEYESIMKNDVWEVVSRSDGKSVVTSNGSLRSSMLQMAVSISIRQDLWLEDSLRKRELITRRLLVIHPSGRS